MKALRIALLPGDGIGKEVVAATKKLLDTYAKFNYVELEMGWEYFVKSGNKTALPEKTLEEIVKCDGGLFGAVSSPSHKFMDIHPQL
jgi:homoisocitrate dehydrogenase